MNYLTTLKKLMKTSFKRSWQLLTILHSVKNKLIKGTAQDWLGAKIMERINERDKVFKKFKKSRLHVDKDSYKEPRNESLQRKRLTLKVN